HSRRRRHADDPTVLLLAHVRRARCAVRPDARVVHHHLRALPGELQRDASADASPGARDHRHPPIQKLQLDSSFSIAGCIMPGNRRKERTMATSTLDPDRVEKELADVTNAVTSTPSRS